MGCIHIYENLADYTPYAFGGMGRRLPLTTFINNGNWRRVPRLQSLQAVLAGQKARQGPGRCAGLTLLELLWTASTQAINKAAAKAVETTPLPPIPAKHGAFRRSGCSLRARYALGQSCLTPEEKVVLGKGSKEKRASWVKLKIKVVLLPSDCLLLPLLPAHLCTSLLQSLTSSEGLALVKFQSELGDSWAPGPQVPRPSPDPGRWENPERSSPLPGNALGARPLTRMLSRAAAASRKLCAVVAAAAAARLQGGTGRTDWRAGALGRGCGSRPRFLGVFGTAKLCARSQWAREATNAEWTAGGAEPPGGAGSEPGSPRLGTRRRGWRCSTASPCGGATVMWRPSTSATARWSTSRRRSSATPAVLRSYCWTPTSSASCRRWVSGLTWAPPWGSAADSGQPSPSLLFSLVPLRLICPVFHLQTGPAGPAGTTSTCIHLLLSPPPLPR